ncbi:hypothetical protein RYX36_027135 [Vicia faba]
MNTPSQVILTLIFHNIWAKSHTSSIHVDTTCLLYYILDERLIYVARIISNEIRAIASSGHRLGTKTIDILAFPSLVAGLCNKACVALPVVVHETIDSVMNDEYIGRNYMSKLDAARAPQ